MLQYDRMSHELKEKEAKLRLMMKDGKMKIIAQVMTSNSTGSYQASSSSSSRMPANVNELKDVLRHRLSRGCGGHGLHRYIGNGYH